MQDAPKAMPLSAAGDTFFTKLRLLMEEHSPLLEDGRRESSEVMCLAAQLLGQLVALADVPQVALANVMQNMQLGSRQQELAHPEKFEKKAEEPKPSGADADGFAALDLQQMMFLNNLFAFINLEGDKLGNHVAVVACVGKVAGQLVMNTSEPAMAKHVLLENFEIEAANRN